MDRLTVQDWYDPRLIAALSAPDFSTDTFRMAFSMSDDWKKSDQESYKDFIAALHLERVDAYKMPYTIIRVQEAIPYGSEDSPIHPFDDAASTFEHIYTHNMENPRKREKSAVSEIRFIPEFDESAVETQIKQLDIDYYGQDDVRNVGDYIGVNPVLLGSTMDTKFGAICDRDKMVSLLKNSGYSGGLPHLYGAMRVVKNA